MESDGTSQSDSPPSIPRPPRTQTTLAWAAALVIVLLLALGYALLTLHTQTRQASEGVAHTHRVNACLNDVRAYLAQAQSSQRGFLFSGDTAFLEARDRNLVQLKASLRLCGDITYDNPRQQRRLRELQSLIEQRLQGFERQLQLKAGQPAAPPSTALIREIDEARVNSDSVFALFVEMQAEEDRLLRERRTHDDQLAQRFQALLVGLGALSVLAIGGVFMLVGRLARARWQAVEELEQASRDLRAAVWQRQRTVLNAVPSAVLMTDDEGRLVFVNAQLGSLFRYSEAELIGQPIEILVPERFRATHVDQRDQYFSRPSSRAMGAGRDLYGLRSDGVEIPVEIGLNPMITNDGRFVLASIIDLSERQREAERLRLVIEAAPNAMLMTNESGAITLVNTQAEQLFGYTREELLGQSVDILVPMHVRQQHATFRARFNAQPSVRSMGVGRELFGLRRDGARVPIEIGLNPIQTSEGLFVLASIIDISERKRALDEELRRVSEALASRFEETRAAALTLFNTEFDEQRILAGTLDLLAERHQFPVALFYSADPLGGLLHLTAARGAPSGVQQQIRIGDGMVGSAAQGNRMIYIDHLGNDHTGSGITIQTGFSELLPPALLFCPVGYRGQLLGVLALGASESLTDNDRAAVERLTAQLGAALHNIKQYGNLQVLAQQLRERGEEIQLKNNQLEAASRAKSEFLANMSHELRTPLNAIIGFAEVLKDGLAGELSAQQNECVVDIFDSGQHLLALINDILDLSKIEAGRLEPELEAADPVKLIQTGVTVLREKAVENRVRLLPRLDSEMGMLALDVRKTKQIIFNLLSNAVKFTPEGGEVHVSAARTSRAGLDSVLSGTRGRKFGNLDSRHDEYLQICIADTGIGIAPEDLERLFEPFTQLDSALSRRHTGTGLGLAMVRRMTELLNGALAVDSTLNRGSTFTVWLPWLPVETQSLPPPLTAEAVDSATPPLILVVEDRVQDAQLLRLQLSEAGYRVQIAESAEVALDVLAHSRPDAIVLDVILPGMDGWDLLSKLKGEAEYAGIPVVIVSVTDEAQHGFVLGAADVLVKPVAPADLMASLRNVGLMTREPHVVLVIDDDPRTVSLLRGQLQAAGFSVISAYGGSDGVALAQAQQPDLIVLDLLMPDLTGFDVMEILRSEPATREIPILVLTAHDLTQAEREAVQRAALKVLEKSDFDAADFIAQVERAVGVPMPGRADER